MEYLEDPMMAVSPKLSLVEARKEVLKFGRLCRCEHNILTGLIYADLYSNCEKIGDHLINVSEALRGRL